MKTRYGVSYWLDQFPSSRRPSYPRHRGHLDIDVVIVGGGLTGCMTAYAFAAAGVRVALLEAGRIGLGASVTSTALVMQEPDVDFLEIERLYGLRAARRAWQMMRRAALDLAATIRRLDLKCRLEEQDSIYFTTAADAVRRLRRECDARRAGGLDASWLNARQLRQATAIDGAQAGILVHGNAQVDPYRACVGFAAAAAERGAAIFEQSPLRRAHGGRKKVEIRTDRGTLRADRIVIATGGATPAYRPLARHLKRFDTYVVLTPPLPAAVRSELGRRGAMLWDTDAPYHYLRWTSDDRVMFGGGDQPHVAARRGPSILVQRTGQLMYELSTLYPAISGVQPEYAWAGEYAASPDGLPLIGPHRNYGRHLFALGHAGNGLASAYLASRILLRAHLDEAAKGDDVFGFMRLGH